MRPIRIVSSKKASPRLISLAMIASIRERW